ncbi:MAG: hypothetical protein ACFFB3_00365, partial [Candidatus Hodarchaeota archaeon]
MEATEKGFLLVLLGLGMILQGTPLNTSSILTIQPVTAENRPTVCTIHPDRSVVWPGEVLQFTVYVVTSDRQGVEAGLVTIDDLNSSWTQNYLLQQGSKGKLVVLVDVMSVVVEGKHIWQAEYHGDAQ